MAHIVRAVCTAVRAPALIELWAAQISLSSAQRHQR